MSIKVTTELFDLDWYCQASGQNFKTMQNALDHYLLIGEKKGLFPNPLFDPDFYRARYELGYSENALLHFAEEGAELLNDPNKFFLSQWYQWQHPASKEYVHPIIHYLGEGGRACLDPSPFVDMTKYMRCHDRQQHGAHLLNNIINSKCGPEVGVYQSFSDLVCLQREFINGIEIECIRNSVEKPERKYLLWVQAGGNSKFFTWFNSERNRNWDLLVNYYDGTTNKDGPGEYIFEQKGTKFTGIYNVWRYTDIFEEYDYVFFIDDDLMFKQKSVDEFFNEICDASIDLAQPSLSKNSHCVWPVFFNKKNSVIRKTNGVEIMMPAFSKRALNLLLPYFYVSISGFGLDLLFAKLANEHSLEVGVVDSVIVKHESNIDQEIGAYYEFLREHGINSKLELWRLISEYDLEQLFYEV